MGKVIVIYHSQTGFTEKMAEVVTEGAKSMKAVDVELFKLGTPFSITKLNQADAIILGSPVVYDRVTPEMKIFLDSVKDHWVSKRLNLNGKVGGAFGSYAFSGGWVIRKLSEDMSTLGIRIVAAPVSVVDGLERRRPIRLDEPIRKSCYELGRGIAEKVL